MSAMYGIIKDVITSGQFSLNAVDESIERCYLTGKITEAERAELAQLAQDNAVSSTDVDPMQAIAQLANRVKYVENALAALQTGGGEPAETTYPEWSTGMVVYKGDRVIENGRIYEYSKDLPGSWAPSQKPDYWQLVE